MLEETILHNAGVLQALISPWKGKWEKKKKEKNNLLQHGYSYLVTHPNTNPTEQGLTLLSGRDVLMSLWYGDSTLNALFLFLRWKKVTERERKKSLILAGKIKNEKNERDENENYYLLW